MDNFTYAVNRWNNFTAQIMESKDVKVVSKNSFTFVNSLSGAKRPLPSEMYSIASSRKKIKIDFTDKNEDADLSIIAKDGKVYTSKYLLKIHSPVLSEQKLKKTIDMSKYTRNQIKKWVYMLIDPFDIKKYISDNLADLIGLCYDYKTHWVACKEVLSELRPYSDDIVRVLDVDEKNEEYSNILRTAIKHNKIIIKSISMDRTKWFLCEIAKRKYMESPYNPFDTNPPTVVD